MVTISRNNTTDFSYASQVSTNPAVVVQSHPTRIVVPLDGSGLTERAIPQAVEMARKYNAELIIIHVFKPSQSYAEAQGYLDSACNKLRKQKVNVWGYLTEGKSLSVISDFIMAESVDLVVMIQTQLGKLEKLFQHDPVEIIRNQTQVNIHTIEV